MSRAYRIQIKDSEKRTVRACDEISTKLELLDILPPEATAELLRTELKKRGFKECDDGTMSREDEKSTVTVDPCSGEVVVKVETESEVEHESTRDGHAIDDIKDSKSRTEKRLTEAVKKDIEKKFQKDQNRSQEAVTEELEKAANDLQPEISDIVNKITREALKAKAAQMGRVQEISENDETGSLTIKIEV
jgi:hypothetical protein